MAKLLFDRTSKSVEPTWNHDPNNNLQIKRILEDLGTPTLQYSMLNQRSHRRSEMWNRLAGRKGLTNEYRDRWLGSCSQLPKKV